MDVSNLPDINWYLRLYPKKYGATKTYWFTIVSSLVISAFLAHIYEPSTDFITISVTVIAIIFGFLITTYFMLLGPVNIREIIDDYSETTRKDFDSKQEYKEAVENFNSIMSKFLVLGIFNISYTLIYFILIESNFLQPIYVELDFILIVFGLSFIFYWSLVACLYRAIGFTVYTIYITKEIARER